MELHACLSSVTVRSTTSCRALFGVLALLALQQITAAQTSSPIHQRLLSGRRIFFRRSSAEITRTIPAAWLVEAARKGVKLDVTNAIIRDRLDLRQRNFEREVSLVGCDFELPADFSYSIFKHNLVLKGSIFRRGISFESGNVQLKAILDRIEFDAGEANFRDVHVHGFFSMQGARFNDGVKAFFNSAQFDKGADFTNSIFGGPAIFEDVESGSDLTFQGTRASGAASGLTDCETDCVVAK